LVLAIGIVVDDAIVVVENVQRNIESGLAPLRIAYGNRNHWSRSFRTSVRKTGIEGRL
jgi:Cu/Ag efflux pump CusA